MLSVVDHGGHTENTEAEEAARRGLLGVVRLRETLISPSGGRIATLARP